MLFSRCQVSELGLSEEVLPVLPGHRGAARRLIHTDRWGLVDVPSGPSWLLRSAVPCPRRPNDSGGWGR